MAVFARLMSRLGYVPAGLYVPLSQYQAELARLGQIEKELRHSKRDLENQLTLRASLETEVGFLRQLELARASRDTDTCRAIDKLDVLCNKLDAILGIGSASSQGADLGEPAY